MTIRPGRVRLADRGAGNPRGACGGAVCPNLLQRPESSRNARRGSLIFCDFLHCRSCRGGPLQQIWTRSHSGPPQESHPHHPAPNHPRHLADPGSRVIALGEKGSVKVIQRAVMRARGAGPTMCSWWRSSAWTTYAPLDYLRAVGPFAFRWATRVPLGHPAGAALLECEMHISASGDLRRSPRDRRVTREHVPLADVLAG